MQKHAFLFLLCLYFTSAAIAQKFFTGKVISNEDGLPVEGVTVTLGTVKVVATTDKEGQYTFEYSNQNFVLIFSHVGFQPSSINVKYVNQVPVIILTRSNNFLAETTVRAYERNAKLADIPVAISILNKADLDRYGSSSFVPAVNTVTGVKMDERSPGSYRLSIRGNLLRSPFGIRNVKMYWNGIPFTDANGNTYLNQVGFNNISKMEIIKGPAGSMYGAGTSGVVLLTGRNAVRNENSISLNTTAGSYGLLATDLTYRIDTNNINSTLSYAHQQSDGYRKQTAMRRDVANYTGSFNINKKQNISANIFYSDLYYETPGGLTQAQMNADPKQARPAGGGFPGAEAQKAALYLKTFYASLANEYHFNNRWKNTTGAYASSTDFKNPTIRNYEKRNEQGVGGRTVFENYHQPFKINFGGEYQYGYSHSSVSDNVSGNRDTLRSENKINASIYNIFAQGEIAFSGFVINGGLSYNNYHYAFTDLYKNPLPKESRSFKPELMPRISVLKEITRAYKAYATISKGFSPPSIDEIRASDGVFNRSLNAEKGTNYEIGLRMDLLKHTLYIDASYYLFGLKNTIVSRRDSSGADYFVNAGKTHQQGFELFVNYFPLRDGKGFFKTVKLWTNYTYIHARFKDYKQETNDYSGNKLTGTAPNVFFAGADISVRYGLYCNITYNYTSSIPLNDANTFYAAQYNLLQGKVGCKRKLSRVLQAEAYLSFDRSFNNPYSLGNDLNAAGNRFFNPSAPENYYAGLRITVNLK